MCGISGFVSSKPYLFSKQEIIQRMLAVLLHRGPDDDGIFVDRDTALGIRRLSIIDLAGGHQPVHNEDGSVWLVYNGEIYNFSELRAHLIEKGHIFYTKGDTEVIVHLFEEYGHDCVNRLEGMFAFAVWDKNKDELFIARDRFGIKPLYYSDAGTELIFASEIKAILQFPGFKRDLDLAALDGYLSFEYIPAPRSIFQRITKLPAGHCLIYKDKKVSLIKYWDLQPNKQAASIKKSDARENLLELIKNSVKRQLVSDVPLGVLLSGGIDSSLITALACGIRAQQIKTFSIGFKEDSFDESPYIRRVAQLFGSKHYHHIFNSEDLRELVRKSAGHLDEPLADASFFPTCLLSGFARNEVKVVLSGDGADELFAGYPTYQAHKLVKYYQALPRFIRKQIIEKIVSGLPVSMSNFSFDFRAKKFIRGALLPAALRHINWMGSFSGEEKARVYLPARKESGRKDSVDELLENFSGNLDTGLLNSFQYLDIKTYLQDDILVKTDRAGMLNSLEVRVPYLDKKIAEFVFGLPPRFRLNNFKTKYILKQAAAKILPQNIINRRKKGFGIPVALWINGPLKELILDVLEGARIKREGLFDYSFIERLLEQHFQGRADNHKQIWTLFMFELWMQEYLS